MAEANDSEFTPAQSEPKTDTANLAGTPIIPPQDETDSFEFVYNGPNLETGSMNARALAEVLSGLSKAFSIVAHDNDLGDRYELRVRDVDSGSFHILFEAVAYVKANPVSSAVLLQAASVSWTVAKDTTSGVYTVLNDIIKMVNAKIKLKGNSANQATVSLSEEGATLEASGEKIVLTKNQYELLLSRRIEKPLAQIVSPLQFGTVTSLDIARERGKPLAHVDYKERDYFDYKEATEHTVQPGTELVGHLNSLSKTSLRGTFHTSDGVHVAYRYTGGDQTLLMRGFSTKDFVKVVGRIRYDSDGVPSSMEIEEIESVRDNLFDT